jgi:hypothetical protein
MTSIKLFDYQKESLSKLRSGSILCGGVGSGKSLTAIAYYYVKECGGSINPYSPMEAPKDLYIITTARKRDTREWDKECTKFLLSVNDRNSSSNAVLVTVDSWNNIGKYVNVDNAFFIFDEQRVIGYGAWVKSFLKICKKNKWLLLSATPGDTWLDFIPVFIANGFYKNRTDFLRSHVIFSPFSKYPKVDRYIDTWKLLEYKKKVLVHMDYKKNTVLHNRKIPVSFDEEKQKLVLTTRWNIFENKPIVNAAELCYILRKISNSDPSRLEAIENILLENKKIIVFYNFNYELDLLKELGKKLEIPVAEWNGHRHELIPEKNNWMYLVQYTAGAEGWNCIETNTIVFYSQNYSYKVMIQAAGRIDRLNTPYIDLYYYHLVSGSMIDFAIARALKNKRNFNESDFHF